jgi:hypothetical protein
VFYEIIYETGDKSVAEYANDEEAMSAINAHVLKAKSGESATPMSTDRYDLGPDAPVGNSQWPASRVVKVLVYKKHPYDYIHSASAVSAEVAKKVCSECINDIVDEDGVVSIPDLVAALTDTTRPLVDGAGAHESAYKMKEDRELAVKA